MPIEATKYMDAGNSFTQIAKFIGPTWGPPVSCRPQMGPMLAPRTVLSGYIFNCNFLDENLNTDSYFT